MRTSLAALTALCGLLSGCKDEALDDPPLLTVSPLALDFGTVGLGEVVTLPITLSNAGGGSVALLTATLSEGDVDVWTIDRNGVDAIGPLETVELLITFEPEDQESESGLVLLRTDFEAEPNWAVTLTASGGASQLDYDGDGFSIADGDCDDNNDQVNPGAAEQCNGSDDDCSGSVPPDEADDDYDGWLVCEDDCEDDNGQIFPGAPEICDQLDNDCDGATPDDADIDLDGYTICDGDCNDAEARTNPGRAEVCDGVDNDCNAGIDDVDVDGDGHSVCSAAGDCDDNDPNAFPVVVSTTGSAKGDGTDLAPYDSIATALQNLDLVCRLVLLESGTYAGVDEVWSGGVVTVTGRSGNAADVILEATAYSRHFDVTAGSDLTLVDLTLTAGDAPDDGGAINVLNGTLALDGVTLSGNASANDGGAVSASSSTILLRNGTRFESNVAADDGGAIVVDASTLIDDGTTYDGNSGVRGGAVYVVAGTVAIDGSEFRSNSANEGGALAIAGTGDFQVESSWFALNTSVADGGAMALRDVNSAGGNVRNNRIQDNIASGAGGGIALLGSNAAIRIANNTLTGNDSVGEGAGVTCSASSALGVQLLANVLENNDGVSAIYVASGSGPTVVYNTVYLTNSGIHFAGEVGDGTGLPLDLTNVVRNPLMVAVSDDANPDNDDLTLQAGSPEIDSGPPQALFNDLDASINDRGFTGGPAGI